MKMQVGNRPAYTPGPWRIGRNGAVVSDAPIQNGVPGSGDVDYYGGHLIAESVADCNANLIAAVPELLAAARLACLNFERAQKSGNFLGDDEHESWSALEKAIAKAEGRAQETIETSARD